MRLSTQIHKGTDRSIYRPLQKIIVIQGSLIMRNTYAYSVCDFVRGSWRQECLHKFNKGEDPSLILANKKILRHKDRILCRNMCVDGVVFVHSSWQQHTVSQYVCRWCGFCTHLMATAYCVAICV